MSTSTGTGTGLPEKGTACAECKHLIASGDRSLWYNLFCGSSPQPLQFDPLTGLWRKPEPRFKFVREVNCGNCPLFEAGSGGQGL
jgi:hypothetical protein